MSNLDQQTFRDIVNLLIPHCADPASRKTLVTTALYGCKVLEQLDYSGKPPDFVVQLVTTLLTFGDCELGKSCVVAVLEQVATQVGISQQEQITSLITRIPAGAIESPTNGWQMPESRFLRNYIFISYSRDDLAMVRRITTDLLNAGVNIWLDQTGLKSGTVDWEQALRDAIDDAIAILYMASPSARRSTYVRDELAIAQAKNKVIYPVWVAGTERTDCFPMGLGYVQLVDVRGDTYSTGLQKLIGDLADKQLTTSPKVIVDTSKPLRNPYKGLRAFRAEDEQDFFGRDMLIEALITNLGDGVKPPRLLAVLGASGSGKSSVVMAGLLPRLQEGAVKGSENWLYLDPIVPGTHPIESLTITLRREMKDTAPRLIREELEDKNKRGLHALTRELSNKPVVLYIDQFEELFTLVHDESERRQFIDLLTTAITEPYGVVTVMLSMRADFYDRPAQYKEFGALLHENHVLVTPMSLADLYDVVQKPAQEVGLTFDAGLVTEMVFAVREEVAALPLLQFTLDQLYEKRNGRILSLAAYTEMGGVQGALAQHAEATFNNLPSEKHKTLARALFLRLIEPGVTEQDTTRRRATSSELTLLEDADTDVLRETADIFVDARLLVSDKSGSERTIEVSHEALIRQWQRLSQWLREKREDLRTLKSLNETVALWKSRNQPEDMLYRGTVLKEAEAWAERNHASKDELAFIVAGKRHEEALRLQAEQRLYKQLTALTNVSTRIAASIDYDEVIELTLDEMRQIVPCETLSMWHRNNSVMVKQGHRGFDDSLPGYFRFHINDYEVIQQIIETRSVISLTSKSNNIPKLGLPNDEYIQSWMGVPLLGGEDLSGLLLFTSSVSDKFTTQQEQQVAFILASQAAIALANAVLFEQTLERTNELGTLLEAAQAMSLNSNLTDVFSTVGELMFSALEMESCLILIGNEVDNELEVQYSGNRMGDDQRLLPLGTRYSISDYPARQRAMSEREVVVLVDVEDEALLSSYPFELEEMRASGSGARMIVPLVVVEKAIGIIQLEQVSNNPDKVSQQKIRLANALGSQVAIAIENARLTSETTARFEELLTINQLSQSISSTLKLEDMMPIVREQVPRITNAEELYIALYDPVDDMITFPLAVRNTGKQFLIPSRKLGDDEVSYIIKRKHLLSLGTNYFNIDELRTSLKIQNGEGDIKAYMGVPLQSGAEVLGVLAIRNVKRKRDFNINDDRILTTIGSQLGSAIQNARLFEQVQESAESLEGLVLDRTKELAEERDRLDALYQITSELARTLLMEQLLKRSLEMVSKAVGADDGVIMLNDPTTDKLHTRSWINPDNIIYIDGEDVRTHPAEGLATWMIQKDSSDDYAVVMIDDLHEQKYWGEAGRKTGLRSALAVMLENNEEPMGMMVLLSKKPSAFTERHLKLLIPAANQVAASINSAVLYQLIRDQSERMGKLLISEQEAAQQNSAILESIADGVVLANSSGEIILFNTSAERILDISRADILGQEISSIQQLDSGFTHRWVQSIKDWSSNAEAANSENENSIEQITHANKTIQAQLSPIYIGDSFLGVVAIFRETTKT